MWALEPLLYVKKKVDLSFLLLFTIIKRQNHPFKAPRIVHTDSYWTDKGSILSELPVRPLEQTKPRWCWSTFTHPDFLPPLRREGQRSRQLVQNHHSFGHALLHPGPHPPAEDGLDRRHPRADVERRTGGREDWIYTFHECIVTNREQNVSFVYFRKVHWFHHYYFLCCSAFKSQTDVAVFHLIKCF